MDLDGRVLAGCLRSGSYTLSFLLEEEGQGAETRFTAERSCNWRTAKRRQFDFYCGTTFLLQAAKNGKCAGKENWQRKGEKEGEWVWLGAGADAPWQWSENIKRLAPMSAT